jgi:16S rRNA (uracil1498-N3)-methyltransferase
MNRFFLKPSFISDKEVNFPTDISHQMLQVLRLKTGDEVEVLDNLGHCYVAALSVDYTSKQVKGTIVQTKEVHKEGLIELSLCFGMTNRDKVEWILQKGTEIGVSAFYPFISSRTLVQSTAMSSKRTQRWERIIREAAEQSGKMFLPVLHQPMEFEACIENLSRENPLCLVAWEDADTVDYSLQTTLIGEKRRQIALFVGPEGGFSTEEINHAQTAKCEVVSLGNWTLRMETAAIVFPALVLYELGRSRIL